MLLSPAVSLATQPRCFGCRRTGAWACSTCLASLRSPLATERIPCVDQVLAAWAYDGVARDLILALKLRGKRPAAEPLATAMTRAIQNEGSGVTAITWVPGRAAEMRRRGFDHAEVIARAVGASLGLPVIGMLDRTGHRPDQTALSGSARRRNLKGAFTASKVAGQVMVIDDLVTTGATAEACARALRSRGATYVAVAAPCRV